MGLRDRGGGCGRVWGGERNKGWARCGQSRDEGYGRGRAKEAKLLGPIVSHCRGRPPSAATVGFYLYQHEMSKYSAQMSSRPQSWRLPVFKSSMSTSRLLPEFMQWLPFWNVPLREFQKCSQSIQHAYVLADMFSPPPPPKIPPKNHQSELPNPKTDKRLGVEVGGEDWGVTDGGKRETSWDPTVTWQTPVPPELQHHCFWRRRSRRPAARLTCEPDILLSRPPSK